MKGKKLESDETIFGNVYDKYTSRNPIVRKIITGFAGCVTSLLSPLNCKRVIDIGCGEGYFANIIRGIMPEVELFAFDLRSQVPALGILDRTVHFHVGSVYEMPYRNSLFDLVIAVELLEHLDDYKLALSEIKRVASGYCLFSVPNEPYWRLLNIARLKYLTELGNTPGHCQHWNRRGFAELIKNYFEIVAVRTPLPWIVVLAKV